MRLILVLFFLIFALYSAQLQHPIDLSVPNKNIGASLSVFEDKSGKMDFSEIQMLPSQVFIPLERSVDSHLFTQSAFWYRCEVSNTTQIPLKRLVVIGIPWIDFIHINVLPQTGGISTAIGGNSYPYAQRSYDHRFPNFELSFVPGVSTVYFQIKTRDPFIVPISIVENTTFLNDGWSTTSHMTFIYGFLMAMALYNLFLFFGIREKYYAYYVVYLSCFVLMNMSYNGFTFKLFFSDYPQLQDWAQSTTIFLFSISGLLFARSFLNFKKYVPFLNRLTWLLILVFVLTMVISAFAGYHYHVIFAIALSVFYSLYVFAIAVYSLHLGNRSAKFFLLGTVSGLIGTSVTALSVMAILPYTDIGFKAVDYGLLIDAVLLSLALADRVKITDDEKRIAEKEAKTDSLTGLPNRRAYYEHSIAEVELAHRYGFDLCMVMIDIDYFKTINDTYGHSAGDRVLQQLAHILTIELRKNDYVFRIGGEEFVLLFPNTKIEEATLLAKRIRSQVNHKPLHYEDKEISFTVSIGISEYITEDKNNFHALVRRADEALYRAKRSGRDQVSL